MFGIFFLTSPRSYTLKMSNSEKDMKKIYRGFILYNSYTFLLLFYIYTYIKKKWQKYTLFIE